MRIEPRTSLRDYTSRSVGSERRAPGRDPRAEATTPMSILERGPGHGPAPLDASSSIELPRRGRLVTVARAGVSTLRAWLAPVAGAAACLGASGCLPDAERGGRRFEPPPLANPAGAHPAAARPGAVQPSALPPAALLEYSL